MLADWRTYFVTIAVGRLAIRELKKIADLSFAHPLTFNFFSVNLCFQKAILHLKSTITSVLRSWSHIILVEPQCYALYAAPGQST
jgi:hypothetical protein